MITCSVSNYDGIARETITADSFDAAVVAGEQWLREGDYHLEPGDSVTVTGSLTSEDDAALNVPLSVSVSA